MAAYLDHAASTPVRLVAVEAMLPFLTQEYGNPSGAHRMARAARAAIDDAREIVAGVLGARPGEVVFTSGGTEADNLAVLGVHDRAGGTLVGSAVEHHAVLDPVRAAGGVVVPVGGDGVVDLDALGEVLVAQPDVTLVSVMAVNNEVGTVQPLAEVADVVRRVAPRALLHTDAVQAVSWLDVAEAAAGYDLVSISAHKFGGPKGVGALRVGPRAEGLVGARQIGGGQERERRSGTQNVAGIVALGAALGVAAAERAELVARVGVLRERLVTGLRASIPGLVETGRAGSGSVGCPPTVPGILHVCVPGIESEALLFLLEEGDVFASAASSCASGAMEVSHVLRAMGVDDRSAAGSLRLSMGWASTGADVDAALEVLPAAVARLREYEA